MLRQEGGGKGKEQDGPMQVFFVVFFFFSRSGTNSIMNPIPPSPLINILPFLFHPFP